MYLYGRPTLYNDVQPVLYMHIIIILILSYPSYARVWSASSAVQVLEKGCVSDVDDARVWWFSTGSTLHRRSASLNLRCIRNCEEIDLFKWIVKNFNYFIRAYKVASE